MKHDRECPEVECPDTERLAGSDDDIVLITICRDIPGDHVGGPDCWCCPDTFGADDSVGIQHYLTFGQYATS